jgi:TIR domain
MTGIFISYRREDSGPYAGRLYDALVSHFGPGGVFFDIDTIGPGEDFREVIQKTCSSCKVLLAVIGRHWATVCDKNGKVRLESKNDTLRMEIASGLQNGLRVIPVLVGGAEMPDESVLPEDLQALAYRNAWDLSDKRFHNDVELLVEALKKMLNTPPNISSVASPSTVKNTAGRVKKAPKKKSETTAVRQKTAPTESRRSTISSPYKSSTSLVPLYGISPGKTIESELANIGERSQFIEDKTGEPYRQWKVNGATFVGDKKIVTSLVIHRGDPMPESWQKLGLQFENSYDEWLLSVKKLGYETTIEEEPHTEHVNNQDSLKAVVLAEKRNPYRHEVELSFRFGDETTTSAKGTLNYVWIQAS